MNKGSPSSLQIELDQLYDHAPVGLCFMDRDLRFVRINKRLAAINGCSVEAHVGRTLREVIPAIADIVEPIYRQVIDTGKPALDFEVRGMNPAQPPREMVALVSYYPLIDDGEVLGVHTVVQDITERKRLQEELLAVTEREQRHVGQELHDVTGQELTGSGYLAQSLADQLAEKSMPESEVASKVADGIRRAMSQIRGFSKGLIPVEVSSEGLMAALSDLLETVGDHVETACTFECEREVLVDDNKTATHLYRIAQESITNALKHAKAKNINVTLAENGGSLCLEIRDDGIGLTDWRHQSGSGLGIMAYRAETIGASLEITGSTEPGASGTIVTCSLPQGNRS